MAVPEHSNWILQRLGLAHSSNWELGLIGLVVFVVSFISSLAFVAWVLIRLPADYFQENSHPAAFMWADRHIFLRWCALIGKNLLGLFLVVLGVVLSLPGIPGQGVLTILIGLLFIDFPGKRRLEIKLVSRPKVLGAINKLRGKFKHPPMILGPAAQAHKDTKQDRSSPLHPG